ncbi:hypothetical protein [Quadrisphaera setariae]|uniref:Peptide zinc metalloprotease protein n=1 Tax=Quadrisphaera setariae TaxID=2593304 RepID=A0A5C8ZH65_9ACTN|nr:hypothetical protein [Quadrisphaera setariae]TXR56433.1 hypothetical protein FMM08_10075 [Quadrisphaera setariae]
MTAQLDHRDPAAALLAAPAAADGPAPAPATTRRPPARAAGLELLGELRGSGSKQPPGLVRRSDGQVLQLTPLAYRVLESLDGVRSSAEVAEHASRGDLSGGAELDATGVRFLVAKKLAPLGLLDDELSAPPPRANPLLALRARTPLLGPRAVGAVALALQPLFRLPVVLAAVAALALLDVWLLAVHGLGGALGAVVRDPVLALAVVGTAVAAALFHECGHAAGCRFSGARPGAIGVGLYLVYPAFYTDVNDAYRLGRAGRLRTDLGGLYFHTLAVLALGGAYAVTGAEWLLLAVLLIQLGMLEQLLPLVRYDGYHVLADLVGVPDLFARIGPVLRHTARRGSGRDPRVVGLKPWVRVVVTAWVAVVVPFLLVALSLLLWHLPRLVGALGGAGLAEGGVAVRALRAGQLAGGTAAALNAGLLLLVVAGVLYVLGRVLKAVSKTAWRWSAGRPRRRAVLLAVGGVLVVALVAGWATTGQLPL